MIKDRFDAAVSGFKAGFIKGGYAINATYKKAAGTNLKNGDCEVMSIYRKNKSELDRLAKDFDEDLKSRKTQNDSDGKIG